MTNAAATSARPPLWHYLPVFFTMAERHLTGAGPYVCGCVVTTLMSDRSRPTRVGSKIDMIALSARLSGLR